MLFIVHTQLLLPFLCAYPSYLPSYNTVQSEETVAMNKWGGHIYITSCYQSNIGLYSGSILINTSSLLFLLMPSIVHKVSSLSSHSTFLYVHFILRTEHFIINLFPILQFPYNIPQIGCTHFENRENVPLLS